MSTESTAQRVRELRARLGLSQAAMYEVYHIPRRTVQDWEAGRREPPEYVLYMLEELAALRQANGGNDPVVLCRECAFFEPRNSWCTLCGIRTTQPSNSCSRGTKKED